MRRGRILILLGLILAIGAAAIVFMLLQTTAQTAPEAEIPREDVVVAKQPIAEDELVAERLEMREVPSEMVQADALRTLNGTENMLAKGPIPQGSIVYREMLQTPEEQIKESSLSQLIDAGYVAIAFPIDELSSVSYGLQPGDYVDILVTLPFIDIDQEQQIKQPMCPPTCPSTGGEGVASAQSTDQRQRLATQLTVQKIRVLGVGRWAYEQPAPSEQQTQSSDENATPVPVQPPKYVTLMLQPQDALVVKIAKEYGSRIDLAVRAVDDQQDFATQSVTLDYILARFGIDLPTKQPYTIESLPVGGE
jgi:pilus assembly protein CpaB